MDTNTPGEGRATKCRHCELQYSSDYLLQIHFAQKHNGALPKWAHTPPVIGRQKLTAHKVGIRQLKASIKAERQSRRLIEEPIHKGRAGRRAAMSVCRKPRRAIRRVKSSLDAHKKPADNRIQRPRSHSELEVITLSDDEEEAATTRDASQIGKTDAKLACSLCNAPFVSSSSLDSHIAREHKRERTEANTVELVHSYQRAQSTTFQHVVIDRVSATPSSTDVDDLSNGANESQNSPFECLECGRNFTDERRLDEHRCAAVNMTLIGYYPPGAQELQTVTVASAKPTLEDILVSLPPECRTSGCRYYYKTSKANAKNDQVPFVFQRIFAFDVAIPSYNDRIILKVYDIDTDV